MLTKNDQNDKALVNGSRGVVRKFEDKKTTMGDVRRELQELRTRGRGPGGEARDELALRESEVHVCVCLCVCGWVWVWVLCVYVRVWRGAR